MSVSIRIERAPAGRSLLAFARAAVVMGLLSACSMVPDAINPVEWYKGASDFIAGPDEPDELAVPRGGPAAEAAKTAEAAEATEPAEGLVGDTGRKYAGSVRREVAPTKALARKPAPEQASQQIAKTEIPPPAPPVAKPTVAPLPPDIPETVGMAGRTRVSGGRRVDEQYQRRLAETAGLERAGALAEDGRVRLIPPGGRGKGMAAPPPGPSASFQVAAVDFSAGSARLTPADRQAITAVAKLYRQTGGVIRIVGHPVDPGYSSIPSIEASMARANAVAAELTRQGVPAGKLYVGAGNGGNAGAQVYLDY